MRTDNVSRQPNALGLFLLTVWTIKQVDDYCIFFFPVLTSYVKGNSAKCNGNIFFRTVQLFATVCGSFYINLMS